MTISKKTMQLAAAGGTFGLISLCGLAVGAASFFLPEQKNWWLIGLSACLPMLIGLGLASMAYAIVGRLVKDEAESLPASTLPGNEVIRSGGMSKTGVRRLLMGLIAVAFIALDIISIANFGVRGWWFLFVQILVVAGGTGFYLLINRLRVEEDWMDNTGWPMISGISVVVMAILFVFFVGGPALSQFLADWILRSRPDLTRLVVIGQIAGYFVWALVGVLVMYIYFSHVGATPSKGVVTVTIALPILAIAAFFGFELIEIVIGSFAKSWILYAILAAVLTAIYFRQTEAWKAGKAITGAMIIIFAPAWTVSFAVLAPVGATFGMFGQGAVIVAVVLSYGLYLGWERENRGGE